jgi:hypothetical protein
MWRRLADAGDDPRTRKEHAPMATDYNDNSAKPGLEPPYDADAYAEPPRKEHGCFFYGCIAASVLAMLLLIAMLVGGYLFYQGMVKIINQYTSPTPVELPKVEMPEEDREALHKRFDVFKQAVDKGEETEPLVLSGDELNALLADNAAVAGKVYFLIEGDKLKGQVSLPLNALGLPGVKGRYFNGKATFLANLHEGHLIVMVDSAEVNGQPISEQVMAGLRNKNLAEDAAKDPDNANLLNKLESLEIKDGTITIKARPKEERSPPEKEKEKEKTKEEPPAESPKEPGAEPQPSEETKAKEAPAEKPE